MCQSSASVLTPFQETEEETIRALEESAVVQCVEIDKNGGRSSLFLQPIPRSSHLAVGQLVPSSSRESEFSNPVQEDFAITVSAHVCQRNIVTKIPPG